MLGNNPFVDSARVDTLRMGKRDEVVEPSYVVATEIRAVSLFSIVPLLPSWSFAVRQVFSEAGFCPDACAMIGLFFSAWPFLSPKERSSSSFRNPTPASLAAGN